MPHFYTCSREALLWFCGPLTNGKFKRGKAVNGMNYRTHCCSWSKGHTGTRIFLPPLSILNCSQLNSSDYHLNRSWGFTRWCDPVPYSRIVWALSANPLLRQQCCHVLQLQLVRELQLVWVVMIWCENLEMCNWIIWAPHVLPPSCHYL